MTDKNSEIPKAQQGDAADGKPAGAAAGSTPENNKPAPAAHPAADTDKQAASKPADSGAAPAVQSGGAQSGGAQPGAVKADQARVDQARAAQAQGGRAAQPGGAAASSKPGPGVSPPPAGSPPTAKQPGPGTASGAPYPASAPAAAKRGRSPWPAAFLVMAVLAAALGAALWYQQQEFQRSSVDLERRVQASVGAANQAAERAQQALSLAEEQSRRLAALDSSLNDSREQFDELIQAFQTLTDSSSDLVLINDVDHLVTIAQQQLQLGGNVANAIISLETAQAQLARANRPYLASLQETINGDLDRLRAATPVDVSFLSGQLEELGNLISDAPLLVPDDAAPEPVPAPEDPVSAAGPQGSAADPDAPWWKQGLRTAGDWSRSAWNSVRQDLGQFITVRRVDDATALLISPDQATRFRETLRLRVMTAQLALMMRQPKVWQAETEKIALAVQARYDSRSPQSRQALKIARQLADTSIDVKLPSVANTLQALEALREAGADEAGRPSGEQAPADGGRDSSGESGAAADAPPSNGAPADGATTAPETAPRAAPGADPAREPSAAPPGSVAPASTQSQV